VDPALRVKRLFADGFVEFLVLFVGNVFLLSGPDCYVIVYAVPAPSVDLQMRYVDSGKKNRRQLSS
jgi:hypothetical protein